MIYRNGRYLRQFGPTGAKRRTDINLNYLKKFKVYVDDTLRIECDLEVDDKLIGPMTRVVGKVGVYESRTMIIGYCRAGTCREYNIDEETGRIVVVTTHDK